MSARRLLPPVLACCLFLLAAGGCSRSTDEIKAARATHTGQGQPAAAARAPVKPPANPGDVELVSAVATDVYAGRDDAPFDLRFRLLARPEVSQPLQIELVAVPTPDSQFVRLQLAAQPGDGVTLNGDTSFDDRDLPTGERARHVINALPRQPGVLQIFVAAVATTNRTSLTRQFAIPLIAFGAQPDASGR